MHEFNQSLKYDKRMYAADVKGSIAFSKALLKAGIMDEREQKEIVRGLLEVQKEWEEGKVGLISTVCNLPKAFHFEVKGISLELGRSKRLSTR